MSSLKKRYEFAVAEAGKNIAIKANIGASVQRTKDALGGKVSLKYSFADRLGLQGNPDFKRGECLGVLMAAPLAIPFSALVGVGIKAGTFVSNFAKGPN